MSLVAAIALLAAAPIAGDDPDAIIVTGTPITREEAKKRAAEYVRRAGVVQLKPLARWTDPVCPRTVGVDDAVAAIVNARVRSVATAAGAPVAPTDCQANIVIAFSADGRGLARAVRRKAPDQFAELAPVARDRVLDGTGAIRWWYTTRDESRDGMPISDFYVKLYNSSIVSTQVVRALQSATVVIDVEQAEGTPLDAVASYAAMVALAEFRSNPPPPKESILALFDGETERRELSNHDAALLRGIYTVPPDREAYQQRRQLVTTIRKSGE
ncbi:hypothetical protein GGC65_002042 [Sphingopyxis sp. OAS728]|uniref:hypothetical protein n=1 Tax=Sphingopyxis sp. OAS728 TaxID=2663823 RepID=UPI00178A2A26|nr:hypothetical protein [Sphingopyxis sp. OAS728]MBE1527586.1 hypothetical protein [Sphingopyxis sp. OAS728]